MRKQHALTQDFFERLGSFTQVIFEFLEARRKKLIVRAHILNAEDLSPHLRKDVGLHNEFDLHPKR